MSAERSIAPLAGCTIALRSGVPQALVLANSFRKFHPESEFVLFVLDGLADGESEVTDAQLRFMYPGDLGLKAGEEWRLPMLHTEAELLSIFKPALLRALVNAGIATVAYFDPAMEVFAALDDIVAPANKEKILTSVPSPNHRLGFGDVALADEHDLGRNFIAVSRTTDEFLQAWFDRLTKPSLGNSSSNDEGLAQTSERFIDSYPHHTIADPAFDVGHWNLNPEAFAWKQDHYEVEGKPLRSFNFRGYDPDKPHLLSKYQGMEPRILFSQYPAVSKICDEYREQVIREGYDKLKSTPYRFASLPSGLPIDYRMLRLYREALSKFEQGLDREPPSPFSPDGDETFLNWLNQPMSAGTPIITRYMIAVHEERDDIKQAFPNPIGADAVGFYDWYVVFGQKEMDLPAALLPPDAPNMAGDPIVKQASSAGQTVNVVGYFRAELGIGAAARALVAALEASEIPFNTIAFAGTANRQDHPFEHRHADGGPADVNIVCINADQIANFAKKNGPELLHGRYTIGVWFWEVEDFPPMFHDAFNYVDEVWVASEFMRETFLKVSPKPVFKFHLPILKPQINASLSRADLRLPNQFVFLFSFDFFSVLERKNPVGLIEAFSRAFRPGEGPALVIKTINGDKRIRELEKLRYAARHRPDITLMDGYLSAIENSTLTAQADCYVSLHRSEGFGLTIAEAMALGKPTIATAYSGNLEFTTADNSYLCPFQRVQVGPEKEPYPADALWSEPDIDAAARLLRHVYTNQSEARDRGRRAAEDIRECHSPERAGPIIRDRLAKIRRRRETVRPLRSSAFLEDRLEELEAMIAARKPS
jgi:glycosyltransferase involved in cell wall biosynthesis